MRDKFNINGFGTERIKYELKQRGISEEIIEKVVEENCFDEIKKAAELIEQKYGVYEFDIKERRKIEGFLLRRGFSFSTIKDAFNLLKDEI